MTSTGPSAPTAEVGEVREAHRFDVKKLEAYAREAVDGFSGTLEVRQFSAGQSNPTFLLTETNKSGTKRYVMRKKPPGQLLASAHQVDREYRVMKALADTGVPVPRMYALCEDDSVIGTAFYIMEYLDGRVFTDATIPGASGEERKALYDNLAMNLAKLHAVDYEAVGLGDFGRPGNYFERQVGRWIKQYRGAQTTDVPSMEELIKYLPDHIPNEQSVTIAHGDYRIGNVMFHPTEPRVVAVFDWELATLGHPLSDLGYCCILYHATPEEYWGLRGLDIEGLGFPSQEEFVRTYVEAAGRGDSMRDVHLVFSMFRFAAILDGVRARGLAGNAAADDAEEVGRLALTMAKRGWELAKKN